jgi:hypothetical protein
LISSENTTKIYFARIVESQEIITIFSTLFETNIMHVDSVRAPQIQTTVEMYFKFYLSISFHTGCNIGITRKHLFLPTNVIIGFMSKMFNYLTSLASATLQQYYKSTNRLVWKGIPLPLHLKCNCSILPCRSSLLTCLLAPDLQPQSM